MVGLPKGEVVVKSWSGVSSTLCAYSHLVAKWSITLNTVQAMRPKNDARSCSSKKRRADSNLGSKGHVRALLDVLRHANG